MTALAESTPIGQVAGIASLNAPTLRTDGIHVEFAECTCNGDQHHACDWASRDFINARRHGGHLVSRKRITITTEPEAVL